VIDGATVVTDLADLGYFQLAVSHRQASADAEGFEIQPLHHKILPESPGVEFQPLGAHHVDIRDVEQTDLTVPVSGVSIAFNPGFINGNFINRCFYNSLFI